MKLEFQPNRNYLTASNEPNWGTIHFVEKNTHVLSVNGNIVKFKKWLLENEDAIRNEAYFLGNGEESLGRKVYAGNNIDFNFPDEDGIHPLFDLWYETHISYLEHHNIRFGLRGENVLGYIIGVNNGKGELSLFDPEENIDFLHRFDLELFFQNMKTLKS